MYDYIETAAKILNIDETELDPELTSRLHKINELCTNSGAQLGSRQLIATIIFDWLNDPSTQLQKDLNDSI
jgi:hypothetical protein